MTPQVISAALRGPARTASAKDGRVARARGVASALALALALGGCGMGESGVPPPSNRIFLPTGIATDPTGQWLYVVNSNFDLRYNAGTVVAVDLAKAKADRAATWPVCPTPQWRPGDRDPPRACCRDVFDPEALNCDERGYLDAATTVRIGSFGGAAIVEKLGTTDDAPQRLFVAVRAEPSVTFIDTTVRVDGVSFRCSGEAPSGNATCEEAWKIVGPKDAARPNDGLPEEPYTLALDEQLRILYTGHLFSGVAAIDLCGERPVLASVNPQVFTQSAQGVTTLTLAEPGNPLAPLFATGRVFSNALRAPAAEIAPLYLRAGAGARCLADGGAGPKRDLELVPGRPFFSSAFFPSGRDIRGLTLSPDGNRLFLLHRNTGTRDNPAALVAIDRTPDAEGEPVNRAVDTVEICGGATQLSWHDTGRGPRLFVVCFESGQVYIVDPELLIVTSIINAGRGPITLAFSPRDPTVAYLSGFSDNSVSVLDLAPGSPTEYRVVQRIGFPHVKGR